MKKGQSKLSQLQFHLQQHQQHPETSSKEKQQQQQDKIKQLQALIKAQKVQLAQFKQELLLVQPTMKPIEYKDENNVAQHNEEPNCPFGDPLLSASFVFV